jgi:hypothetical protein
VEGLAAQARLVDGALRMPQDPGPRADSLPTPHECRPFAKGRTVHRSACPVTTTNLVPSTAERSSASVKVADNDQTLPLLAADV